MTTPPAQRIWTPQPDVCRVCGLERGRHSVVDAACPHTAESLSELQILALWRRIAFGDPSIAFGRVSLWDCLHASANLRARLALALLPFPEPDSIDVCRAREKIAAVLNTMEPT